MTILVHHLLNRNETYSDRKQKLKSQCHLRVGSDFTGNAAKILYGFFCGTTDALCVIFGMIFIIYCGKNKLDIIF